MIRTLLHVLVGAFAGLAAGILAPIAIYFLFVWIDGGKDQGGGTPFAIMIILTAPIGMMFGIAWGAARANPELAPRMVRMNRTVRFGDLVTPFKNDPPEVHRTAVARMLSHRLSEYRAWERNRAMLTAAICVGSIFFLRQVAVIIIMPYLVGFARDIFLARRELGALAAHWGRELLEAQGPLPLTSAPGELRP